MSFEPNAMMELFRAEVEAHSETLTHSLMALERDPTDASILESIMRAAHSLKGAARIVGVNVAVDVAHVMEDCLVAAQRGELTIKPSDVDCLLNGVDLLVQISEATKSADSEWTPIENAVRQSVVQLKCIRAGQPLPQSQPAQAKVESSPPETPKQPEQPAPQEPAKVVEVAQPAVLTFGRILDRAHADEMRVALLDAIKSDAPSIRFDLSKTIDLDPVGLAFLAASKQHVQQRSNKDIDFSPLSDEIRLVLRMTGIWPS